MGCIPLGRWGGCWGGPASPPCLLWTRCPHASRPLPSLPPCPALVTLPFTRVTPKIFLIKWKLNSVN